MLSHINKKKLFLVLFNKILLLQKNKKEQWTDEKDY